MHGGFGGTSPAGVPSGDEPWVKVLAQHFQLIIYDRRSAGQSSGPPVEHTLELFCADALALLDHLGTPSAAVWGQSAGCAIAITLAIANPEKVDALVLSDGAPWFTRDDEVERRVRERIRVLETEGPAAAYDARKTYGSVGLQLFAGTERKEVTEEQRAKLARQREEFRVRLAAQSSEERIELYAAELRTQKAYLGFDATTELYDLHMPVLVIYGTEDRIFPDVPWSTYATAMPDLTFQPLEGAAHGCGRSPEAIDITVDFLVQCFAELDRSRRM
jgi:pimeloyl-ACP methyl ester carboxylesterase